MATPPAHRPVTTAQDMRPRAHSGDDLVDFIMDLEEPNRSKELNSWLKDLCSLIDVEGHSNTIEVRSLLETGKVLLSRVYFHGLLDTVPLTTEPDLSVNHNKYGSTSGWGYEVKMKIDPCPVVDGCTLLGVHVASTLVHEMCHAFLDRYSCANRACGDEKCMGKLNVEYGQGGHGYTWNLLASVIDTKVKGHFEVDLPLAAKECSADEDELLAVYGDWLEEQIWPPDPHQ
ncbi:hypothetical protein AC579_4230 [Pseudocercospora musae]|uniref:SprT-like domain-containing protein n=1 Tax=Pseudocercospora musae TaxID=113226 RepID=A0A139ICY5_9PEZI|nr:hypothetical protein AC579_4230 [Pseudocercospora musae]